MKKSDVAMIILIASISVMIAFALGSRLEFLAPPKDGAEVRTVEALSSEVEPPSKEVFSAESINPTVQTVLDHNTQ